MSDQIAPNRAPFSLVEASDALKDRTQWLNNWQMAGVVTDSRAIQNGNIFVALKGERFDAHDFLPEVAKIPKILAIVSDSAKTPEDLPHILVEDTLEALGLLARYHRRRFEIPVIGVTGSYGKTTTRALIHAALKSKLHTLTSQANFNNEIGLPMTLFGLESDHEAAVLEMGMRGRGQIEYLAKIAEPTVGVITNIGPQHIEQLGNLDEIARAKAELIENLPENGLAVLPADSIYLEFLKSQAKCRVVTFGMSENADYQAKNMVTNADGEIKFSIFLQKNNVRLQKNSDIDQKNEDFEVKKSVFLKKNSVFYQENPVFEIKIPLPGHHNATNAAAAFAVAVELGVSPRDAIAGLQKVEIPGARMRVLSVGTTKIIDDCYNAGPDSMRAALETLLDFPGSGRRVAILGAMKELGDFWEAEHRKIGHFAGEFVDVLVGVGGETRPLLNAAVESAKQNEREVAVFWCESAGEAAERVGEWVLEGDCVLVKGSRSVGLEVVVEAVKGL